MAPNNDGFIEISFVVTRKNWTKLQRLSMSLKWMPNLLAWL